VEPVALYVHWPYCARICPYCDFNVVRDRGRTEEQAALAEAIVQDLRAQAGLIGPRRLTSIFFGGGTPSLMAPGAVARVVETATALFAPESDLEISLEANPTDAEGSRFRGLAEAGVNRLSLGVQSLDDAALRFLGRNHGADEARRAAQAAGAAFPRLSIDLIYALPDQTPAVWAADLEAGLALGPEHVSPYQLTIEPGTAFDRAVGRGRFAPPDDETGAELYEVAQAVLGANGFHAYEVSNHARGEAARSRHNLAVWRGVDYLGVGPGAHGRLTLDGVRTATVAAPRIGDYIARVSSVGVGWSEAEPLSAREAAEERLMLGLRIEEGVPLATLAPLGLSPDHPRVARAVEDGLLELAERRLRPTGRGRVLLDYALKRLLA